MASSIEYCNYSFILVIIIFLHHVFMITYIFFLFTRKSHVMYAMFFYRVQEGEYHKKGSK